MVMNTNSKRESGRKTQLGNIQAAKVWQSLRRTFGSPFILNIFKNNSGCC